MSVMSEATAETKWCPMRTRLSEGNGNCIASHCAAWQACGKNLDRHAFGRFRPAPNTFAATEADAGETRPARCTAWEFRPYDPDNGDGAGWLEDDESLRLRQMGFCGLAGLPEGF